MYSYITKLFKENKDFVEQQVDFKSEKYYVLYFSTLVDVNLINNFIIKEIKSKNKKNDKNNQNNDGLNDKSFDQQKTNNQFEQSKNQRNENSKDANFNINEDKLTLQEIFDAVCVGGAEISNNYKKVVSEMLSGSVVICKKNSSYAIYAPCQGWEKRAITEPPTSAILKGPREGFVEDLHTNLSLLRRRLRSKDLVIEEQTVGKYSNSCVCICYIDSIADKTIVKKLRRKIKSINIDGIIDSSYIQALIEERPNTIFRQIGNTEKPEVAVAKMLEGRVVIVVEGSPLVLTVPYLLLEDFQSGDDYYSQPMRATFVRWIRLIGLLLAILLPGVYVALQSFHYGLLPIDFLISLLSSIEGISFPPLIEMLFVIFLFEILNEASIRMPKYLGMALSIIGALVLGDTAVKAGIISSPSVMIVAISGITLYIVPDQSNTGALLRVFYTIIGGVAGFFGLLVGFLFLTTYLINLDSYGTPFFAPYTPYVKKDKKDALIKKNLSQMTTRPQSIPNKNKVRMRNDK